MGILHVATRHDTKFTMSLFGWRIVCYVTGAALLGGAGAYMIFGEDTGLGIFFVLVAAVLNRVLILNLAESKFREPIERSGEANEER
jgi:hypothetical protein